MRRVALGALCAALAVGGCGSGGSGGSDASSTTAGDEEAIRATITEILLEGRPALCSEAMTEDFVDQVYAPPGDGALLECRYWSTHRVVPERIEFSRVEVDGDSAHATYEASGNGLGGTESTLALIREDDAWLLDEYTEAEITDRELFEVGLVTTLTGRGGILEESQARCLADASRDISEERLERLAVQPARQFPVSLIRRCVGDGSATGAAAELVRLQFEREPEYAGYARCVSRFVAAKLTTPDALALLRSEDRDTIAVLTKEALLRCGYIPSSNENVV